MARANDRCVSCGRPEFSHTPTGCQDGDGEHACDGFVSPRRPATGKKKYASEAAIRKARRGLRARLRFYRCEHCGTLHFTKGAGK